MPEWTLAKSLAILRNQINLMSPNRSKESDGSIGDAAHASRSSDHNPWVKDGRVGIVTAIDITHDPAHGIDAGKLADILRRSGDPRIKYIISNGRISNPTVNGGEWRPYHGKNPHNKHFHISVVSDKKHYDDTRKWDLSGFRVSSIAEQKPSSKPEKRLLKMGSRGNDVKELQKLLGVEADGSFGRRTEEAVKALQTKAGLVPDGKVGPYTWEIVQKMEK